MMTAHALLSEDRVGAAESWDFLEHLPLSRKRGEQGVTATTVLFIGSPPKADIR
jgi:hypothetical protein